MYLNNLDHKCITLINTSGNSNNNSTVAGHSNAVVIRTLCVCSVIIKD